MRDNGNAQCLYQRPQPPRFQKKEREKVAQHTAVQVHIMLRQQRQKPKIRLCQSVKARQIIPTGRKGQRIQKPQDTESCEYPFLSFRHKSTPAKKRNGSHGRAPLQFALFGCFCRLQAENMRSFNLF